MCRNRLLSYLVGGILVSWHGRQCATDLHAVLLFDISTAWAESFQNKKTYFSPVAL